MIAMETQGLARKSEAQQVQNEGLEQYEHLFTRAKIAIIDPPTAGPRGDIEIVVRRYRR